MEQNLDGKNGDRGSSFEGKSGSNVGQPDWRKGQRSALYVAQRGKGNEESGGGSDGVDPSHSDMEEMHRKWNSVNTYIIEESMHPG